MRLLPKILMGLGYAAGAVVALLIAGLVGLKGLEILFGKEDAPLFGGVALIVLTYWFVLFLVHIYLDAKRQDEAPPTP
jgi:hypothetical protein